VSKLAYVLKDGLDKRYPHVGCDEWFRHELFIPNPFRVTSVDEEDGTKYYGGVGLVVAPWWLCRFVGHRWYREDARAARRDARTWELAEKKYQETDEYFYAVDALHLEMMEEK
jgi:hypothetical protein